jgi:hypothetical protein
MAKAMTFAGGLVCGFMLATGVLATRADDVQAAVLEAAAAAHVDVQDLQGALSSQRARGLTEDPFEYLRSNGELPPVALSGPSRPPIADKWLRLVQCEASGDWHNARNPRYFGGLQFDAPTWARYGGLAFAPRADFATPAQQVLVAERTLAAQGPGAWPVCGKVVGLR